MKIFSVGLSMFALLAVGILSSQAQVGIFENSVDVTDGSNLGAEGSAEYDPATGTYTVVGSGNDIWGNADNFRYVYTEWSGDFDFRAKVHVGDGVNDWRKGMLMARQSLDADSVNIGPLFKGGAEMLFNFQERAAIGDSSSSTDGSLRPPDVNGNYIRFVKSGDAYSAYWRVEGESEWNLLETRSVQLSDPFLLGLAVTAHETGELVTTTYSEVSLAPGNQFSQSVTWNGGLGAAPLPGSAKLVDGAYIVNGNGRDIWQEADDGFFLFQELSGDGAISAKVRWIDGGQNNDWAKAGIMIRDEGTDPASAHYWIELRSGAPVDGLALGDRTDAQWREVAGGASGNAQVFAADGSSDIASPDGVWYRVSKNGSEFTSSYSLDGSNWSIADVHTVEFTDNVAAYGLVVTSHTEDDEIVTAEFTDVSVGTSGLQASSVGDEWSLYE